MQAAYQQLTVEWWARRERFDLFVSEAVLAEVRRGDPEAAARRLGAAEGLRVLAAIDAAHVAIATAHGLDFLLTWNCTHIANATMRPRIDAVCRHSGFQPPIICTPEELTLPEET